MSFDNVCKLLAEKYPADFVHWLIAEDSTDIKVLKTELSIEPIRVINRTGLGRIASAPTINL
jgi:predicted transposase YdaD